MGSLVVMFATMIAVAPRSDVRVEYHAPPSCPEREALTASVRQNTRTTPGDAPLYVRAEVLEHDGYELHLEFVTDDGEPVRETMVDPDCAVLIDAAAVRLAFAIERHTKEQARRASDETTAPTPTPTPTPAVVAPLVPEPVDEVRPASSTPASASTAPSPTSEDTDIQPRRCRPGVMGLCAGVALRIGVLAGALPSVAPGLGGHVALLGSRFRAELGAAHWFRREADTNSGAGGDLRLTHADLAGCARFGTARLEVPVCAGVDVGVMHGEGAGVSVPRTDRVIWSSALLHVRLTWSPIERIALFAQPQLVVPFNRYRFLINGDELVHRPGALAFRAFAGAELRLW